MPRARPAMSWAASISTSGFSRSPISSAIQALSRSCTFSLSGAGEVLVGNDDDDRLERVLPGLQPRDLLLAP